MTAMRRLRDALVALRSLERLEPDSIAQQLCHEHGWSLHEIRQPDRRPEPVAMRKLICDQLTIRGYKPSTIAAVLHRHRTTVLHHLGRG